MIYEKWFAKSHPASRVQLEYALSSPTRFACAATVEPANRNH
jgi:hypothetical protein